MFGIMFGRTGLIATGAFKNGVIKQVFSVDPPEGGYMAMIG